MNVQYRSTTCDPWIASFRRFVSLTTDSFVCLWIQTDNERTTFLPASSVRELIDFYQQKFTCRTRARARARCIATDENFHSCVRRDNLLTLIMRGLARARYESGTRHSNTKITRRAFCRARWSSLCVRTKFCSLLVNLLDAAAPTSTSPPRRRRRRGGCNMRIKSSSRLNVR